MPRLWLCGRRCIRRILRKLALCEREMPLLLYALGIGAGLAGGYVVALTESGSQLGYGLVLMVLSVLLVCAAYVRRCVRLLP